MKQGAARLEASIKLRNLPDAEASGGTAAVVGRRVLHGRLRAARLSRQRIGPVRTMLLTVTKVSGLLNR
jgi:hypothetical protein